MARNNRIPKLRRHASGAGFVELSGRRIYCGKLDEPATVAKANRLVEEWLATGRRLPRDPEQITVVEIPVRFMEFADGHYRRADGSKTCEIKHYRSTLKTVRGLYGDTTASAFGPKQLNTVREAIVQRGLCRTTVNAYTKRVRRVFRWAASEELFPGERVHAMAAVPALMSNRTAAPEPPGVGCAPQEHIDAVLPELREDARCMVLLQLLTGMRPGEVVSMKRDEVDTSGEQWIYVPLHWKLSYLGKVRLVPIGPQAKELLAPFLLSAGGKVFGFSSTQKYREHTQRACKRAGVPRVNPGQLRHNAGQS